MAIFFDFPVHIYSGRRHSVSQYTLSLGHPAEESAEGWMVRHGQEGAPPSAAVHYHDGYEFLLHVQGGGGYQLEQQRMALQPYQLVVVLPNVPHGFIGPGPAQGCEYLMVRVNAATLSQMQYAGTTMKNILDRFLGQPASHIQLTPQDYLHIKSIASVIRPPQEVLTPLERIEVIGALSVLLSRFCRAATDAHQLERRQAQDGLLQDVYNHILERFSEDCSLEALAERFSISKYHLAHRFSQLYGTSLHQFVLHCRMAYAQLLIRQGEPMMSIAYQCGFNDYSTFVRAFTRFNGTSPRNWRRLQQTPLAQLPRV